MTNTSSYPKILFELSMIQPLIRHSWQNDGDEKENCAGDNLLIYFSGHGFYDKGIDEGYWIPVECA